MNKTNDSALSPPRTLPLDNHEGRDVRAGGERLGIVRDEPAAHGRVRPGDATSSGCSSASKTLADDILYGAAAIAEFLFGDPGRRRRVYYLASRKGKRRLPTFRMGGAGICARRSVILAFIRSQETD